MVGIDGVGTGHVVVMSEEDVLGDEVGEPVGDAVAGDAGGDHFAFVAWNEGGAGTGNEGFLLRMIDRPTSESVRIWVARMPFLCGVCKLECLLLGRSACRCLMLSLNMKESCLRRLSLVEPSSWAASGLCGDEYKPRCWNDLMVSKPMSS